MGMIGRLVHVAPVDERSADTGVDDLTDGATEGIDLDKAWHGIHFLLTGEVRESNEGVGRAIFGGEPFGSDYGSGRPRYLAPDEVAEIARELAAIDVDDLASEFDPRLFSKEGIYPDIWDDETALEYLLGYFETLRAYYAEAAADDRAMVSWIS